MRSFLTPKRFRTFEKLSRAIQLLLRKSISPRILGQAAKLLHEFGIEFAEQYGKSNVVMNIHLIANHLVDSCRLYGPLWCFWCYPYENMLGCVKKFIHGTKKPEKSFIFGCHMLRMVPALEYSNVRSMKSGTNPMTPKQKQVKQSTLSKRKFEKHLLIFFSPVFWQDGWNWINPFYEGRRAKIQTDNKHLWGWHCYLVWEKEHRKATFFSRHY